MSDNWLSEIRLFPYGRIPSGWHLCDGTILTITSNAALFSLLGNRYGGDGKTNFALPDLRGRVPLHYNPSDPLLNQPGKTGGVESVTLTVDQIPPHNHSINAFTANGAIPLPLNGFPSSVAPNATSGTPPAPAIYGPMPTTAGTSTLLNGATIESDGGGQAHENRQPTMALNWCICVSGYYPARN